MPRVDPTLEITHHTQDSWWDVTQGICQGQGEVRPAARTGADGIESQNSIWLTAQRCGQVVGSCRGEPAPGGTATVFPPSLMPDEPCTTGLVLLETATDHFQTRRQGCLVYALARDDESASANMLLRCGFRRIGPMLHMSGSAADPLPVDEAQLEFLPYERLQNGFRRLAETFQKTCHQTLDFPELHQWLSFEQSLGGYRDVGDFRPALWHIIRERGSDVGCLLLNQLECPDTVQLTYIGLIPPGRRFSGEVIQFGRQLAGRVGARQITLAVDQRNAPAVRCYLAAGFIEVDRQTLFAKPAKNAGLD